MVFDERIQECNWVRSVGQVKNLSYDPTLPILALKIHFGPANEVSAREKGKVLASPYGL